MGQWLQWAITTIVGALGILAGRAWERFDRQVRKDRELIEKIVNLVPIESEALRFLRTHDFGSPYEEGQTKPFWELKRLLSQPSYFFINKQLEKAKRELLQELADFEALISTEIFVSDRHPNYWELPNPHDVIVSRALIKRQYEGEISDEEFAQLEEDVRNEHNRIREQLNMMSENICKKYDILMSKAHRDL